MPATRATVRHVSVLAESVPHTSLVPRVAVERVVFAPAGPGYSRDIVSTVQLRI